MLVYFLVLKARQDNFELVDLDLVEFEQISPIENYKILQKHRNSDQWLVFLVRLFVNLDLVLRLFGQVSLYSLLLDLQWLLNDHY